MTSLDPLAADDRLDVFLDYVTAPLETLTQKQMFDAYAAGLLSDAERKSMEPLAAQARPDAPIPYETSFTALSSCRLHPTPMCVAPALPARSNTNALARRKVIRRGPRPFDRGSARAVGASVRA